MFESIAEKLVSVINPLRFHSKWLKWIFFVTLYSVLFFIGGSFLQINDFKSSQPYGHFQKDTIDDILGRRARAEQLVESNIFFVLKRIAVNTPQGIREYNDIQYDYNAIISALAAWLAFLYTLRVLDESKAARETLSKPNLENKNNAQPGGIGSPESSNDSIESNESPHIETLLGELYYCREVASQMQGKSTYLLAAGILLSFVGIFIFYISVPSLATKENSILHMSAIRPVLMLFFVQAVAWFLLRQYQKTSNDYLNFHEDASKRARILAAFQFLENEPTGRNRDKMIESLLKENAKIILKEGEVTEDLKGLNSYSANPLFDMASKLIDKIPNTSSPPPKI